MVRSATQFHMVLPWFKHHGIFFFFFFFFFLFFRLLLQGRSLAKVKIRIRDFLFFFPFFFSFFLWPIFLVTY